MIIKNLLLQSLNQFRNLIQETSGLTTVEYALAGALVTLALVTVFGTLGNTITSSITNMSSVVAP